MGTSRNLDLVLLFLFSKELNLQALQHKEKASREKVWAKRAPIPPAEQCKNSSPPLMDLATSIYMVKEELGAKTKWLQLKKSVA